MKKGMIILMAISLLMMSSFVSAGFFDWLLGGNDMQDVTGDVVAKTAVSTGVARTSSTGSSGAVTKMLSSPISGSRATLTVGKAVRSGQSSLSLVSISNGVATLSYVNTVNVKTGDVIDLGGVSYGVDISGGTTASTSQDDDDRGEQTEPGDTVPGCTGPQELCDGGQRIITSGGGTKTSAASQDDDEDRGEQTEPGDTVPGCTGPQELCDDDQRIVTLTKVAGITAGKTPATVSTASTNVVIEEITAAPTKSTSFFGSLRTLFR